MENVAGKTALITGGSSGVGLAMAKQLAGMGAHVCLLARDPEKLERACQEVHAARRDADQRVWTVAADVANYEQLRPALDAFVTRSQTPDIIINSAGVTYPGEFERLDLEIFHQMMNINYFGTLHVVKALVPGLIERGSGLVINLSSAIGMHGIYGYSAYSPSKSAVITLSDALHYELKHYGIHVCVALPTDIDTPQLEFEDRIKPPVLKAMMGTVQKAEPPDKVGRAILKAAFAGRYLIFPTSDARLLYFAYRLIPGDGFYKLIHLLMAHARRQVAKNNGHH